MPDHKAGRTILPPQERVKTPVPQDTVAVPDPVEAGKETQIKPMEEPVGGLCVRVLALVWMAGIVVAAVFCGVGCG